MCVCVCRSTPSQGLKIGPLKARNAQQEEQPTIPLVLASLHHLRTRNSLIPQLLKLFAAGALWPAPSRELRHHQRNPPPSSSVRCPLLVLLVVCCVVLSFFVAFAQYEGTLGRISWGHITPGTPNGTRLALPTTLRCVSLPSLSEPQGSRPWELRLVRVALLSQK